MEAGGAHDGRAVVICGFGELGQSLANMLESPLAMSLERGRVPYVAFDLQPSRLRAAREAGFNVFYGDASRPAVRRPSGAPRMAQCATLSWNSATTDLKKPAGIRSHQTHLLCSTHPALLHLLFAVSLYWNSATTDLIAVSAHPAMPARRGM